MIEEIKKITNYIFNNRLILAIMVVIILTIIYLAIKKIISKNLGKVYTGDDRKYKKKQTYLKLLNNICKYAVFTVGFITILSIYNVNVSSIIAGLGIVSIISGLALQDALKDIIAGFNIIANHYYSVGDVIEIEEVVGKVISIELKTTKMKDIYTGNIFVVANRNIVKALNISTQLDIDIPAPYEEGIVKIENIIEEILGDIREIKDVERADYKGVQEFGKSAIYYKIRINCHPELKPQVKRSALRIIKIKFDEKNIQIPYTQIDIHQK